MKDEHTDDEEIIRRCCNGETELYRVLVERYQDRIFNLICRFLGNHHLAEDIAQETFIKAFSSLENFRQEARFSTWIYRIAVNKCKDFLKDRRRGEISLDRITMPGASEYSSHPDGPEDGLLRKEKVMTVEDAILTLPLKYREAFILRHVEELPYSDMTRILGLPINTLKMRVFRARKFLTRKLRLGPLAAKQCKGRR